MGNPIKRWKLWMMALFVLFFVGFYPEYGTEKSEGNERPAETPDIGYSSDDSKKHNVYIVQSRIVAVENLEFWELEDCDIVKDSKGKESDMVLYPYDEQNKRALFLTMKELNVGAGDAPEWAKIQSKNILNDMVDVIIILFESAGDDDQQDSKKDLNFNERDIIEIRADI